MRRWRAIFGGTVAVATLVLAGGLLAAGPAQAAAQTRYVATTGSDSENDCTDSGQPCKTIQHAVDQAADGDTVSIAAGTYPESVRVDNTSLTMVGASSSSVTITGNDGQPGIAVNTSGQGSASSSLTLRSLSVQHVAESAGVIAEGTDLTVEDSVINDNGLVGVLAIGSTLTASGSHFDGNRGDVLQQEFGGFGVAAIVSKTTITDSTATGNNFGGVYGVGGLPVLASQRVPGDASLMLSRSTVADNGTVGVAAFAMPTTIANSTIANTAGAGVYTTQDTVELHASTVTGTRHNPDSEPVLAAEGSLVVADLVNPGAARAARHLGPRSALGVVSALTKGAAPKLKRIAAADAPASEFHVTGSIVASDSSVPDCVGTVTDGGYNLSADDKNSCGFGAGTHDLVKTAPKLGDLADNGGPTQTELPKKGSGALDAIPAGKAGCTSGATDQRGVSRPQAASCDIGAVEVAQSPIVIHPHSLPHATVGEHYRAAFTATGGLGAPYEWSLAPGTTLPDGLTLSADGVLSGTPTEAGTSQVTVSVDDPVTKRYTLVIEAAAGPNGNGTLPVADTGVPVWSQTALGAGTVFAGFLMLFAAGLVGRRPGRHRVRP